MITDQVRVSDSDVEQKLSQPSTEMLPDKKRSFLPSPIKTPPEVEKAEPGEINIQFNFKFNCSNSFKVLIGVGLCLSLAWNIYSNERCPAPPVRPIPVPVPPAPEVPPPNGLG